MDGVIQHQPFILIQKTTATLKTRTPPELNFRWGYSVSQIWFHLLHSAPVVTAAVAAVSTSVAAVPTGMASAMTAAVMAPAVAARVAASMTAGRPPTVIMGSSMAARMTAPGGVIISAMPTAVASAMAAGIVTAMTMA